METFISGCDLRVNIWHLEHPLKTFQLVDLKPPAMSELSEVITGAAAHPTHGNIVGYATSRGIVNIVDTRMRARGDAGDAAMTFKHPLDANLDQYDAEILSSVCDFSFSPGSGGLGGGGGNGSLLLARDFLTMKLYDMRKAPPISPNTRGSDTAVKVLPVQTHLQPRLHTLIEQELVFERFECTMSPCGNRMATGCFSDIVCVYNDAGAVKDDVKVPSKSPLPAHPQATRTNKARDSKQADPPAAQPSDEYNWQECQRFRATSNRSGRVQDVRRHEPQSEISCRVSSAQWSPDGATVAFTTANRLFLYDVSR